MVLIRDMIHLCEYTCTHHTHELCSTQLITLSGLLLSHKKAGPPQCIPPGSTLRMVVSVNVTQT